MIFKVQQVEDEAEREGNSEEDYKGPEPAMEALAFSVLLSGLEPTSAALSWALLELAKNQNAQNRLRKEIEQQELHFLSLIHI